MTASHNPVTPIPALRLVPARALAAANQQGLWLATGCAEAARLLATDSLGAWREAGSWVRNFQRNRAAPEVLRVLALKPSAVVFRLAPALGEQASSKATDLGERLAAPGPLAVKGNVLAIEVVGRVDAACRLVLTLAKQRGLAASYYSTREKWLARKPEPLPPRGAGAHDLEDWLEAIQQEELAQPADKLTSARHQASRLLGRIRHGKARAA